MRPWPCGRNGRIRGRGDGGGEVWKVEEVGVLGLQYHSVQTEGSVMVKTI